MSSRLSDLVFKAMELNTVNGRCDTRAATAALRSMLDEDHIERALNALATKLISEACRKSMTETASAPAAQGELPLNLHRAYAVVLDEEGAPRKLVNTFDMTRVEAETALRIRDRQIENDRRSRNDLARAIKAAEPYWDADPSLTFGEALQLAATNQAAA